MPEIPEWCPRHVADKARELHQRHRGSPITLSLIERLATDPEMKRVWHQLGKQSRENHERTGKPLHKLHEKFASKGRDKALAGLFEFAVNIGRLTLMLPSADHPARPYQARADRLEGEAGRLYKSRIGQKIAKQLLTVAVHCEMTTVAAHDPDKSIAVGIAAWLNAAFGSPKYTITAVMTSVITGHAVSDRKVRTWVSHPANISAV